MADDKKFNFTMTILKNRIKKLDGKRVTWIDAGKKGLNLDIRESGQAIWYYRRTVRGGRVQIRMGEFPGMDVDAARDRVDVYAGDVARGKDLSSNRATVRGSRTMVQYFDLWVERHAEPHRPGTVKDDKSLFKKWIEPDLGTIKLPVINRDHIHDLHTKMGKAGYHRRANSMLQLISAMFTQAGEWKMYPGDNPVEGIKRFKEHRRNRYLSKEEAPDFFKALDHKDTPAYAKDVLLLALFTGARKGNVLGMKWEDVQIAGDNSLWVIPAEDAKTGDDYFVPLSGPAVVILEKRLATGKPGNPWVFPATSGKGHRVFPHKVWKAIIKQAGITDLRVHDLRHTLASWQAISGTSLHIVGKSLGHRNTSTTARYAHLSDAPVRASVANAVNALVAAGKTKGKKK